MIVLLDHVFNALAGLETVNGFLHLKNKTKRRKRFQKLNESVESRFGLVVRRYAGKRRDLGSNLLRLSFSSQVVVCGHCLVTVPHNYETLKWLSSLPILMQESFWW